MHRIVSKKQHLTQQGVQFDGTLHVGYDLAYTYGKTEGKKFQFAEVKDANYRTEENSDSVAKVDNNHTYTYDAAVRRRGFLWITGNIWQSAWECSQTRVGLVRKAIQIRSDDMF